LAGITTVIDLSGKAASNAPRRSALPLDVAVELEIATLARIESQFKGIIVS
jgi:hypothetical protein